MKLSIVIVNYNVKYFLEQALLAVRKATKGLAVEVFVVDNNSVDDSVQMLREKFPEIKLMANSQNLGFSKANNQAIAQAKGEYVLLLNPDTVIREDSLSAPLAFMDAHPEAGGLGVKMIDGKGCFLPESKRGFPSPEVAFYKAFGLSKLFPKSTRFNRYHLGYLSADETHEIEVLSGAYMLLRKSVLDQIGYLDEAFFMYGEDIDLSYRVVQAGYKNYYFAGTTIIHYKGESTKKGSLNYVKTFYNAMIIFAQKHFGGPQAGLYVGMLRAAIYFRASLTLLANWSRRLFPLLLDALLIFIGLFLLKDIWANLRFDDPHYFKPSLVYFNYPLYIGIWLTTAFFRGVYDQKLKAGQLVSGFALGSLLIAAVYGFLPSHLRASRMLIVLGTIWAIGSSWSWRYLLALLGKGPLEQGQQLHNVVILGSLSESERVQRLLYKARVQNNLIGTVAPSESAADFKQFLGAFYQLEELVQIYKIKEIIFCAKDLRAEQIIYWMNRLGPEVAYKIVAEDSLSIVGSNSKNSAGDLYTLELGFKIAETMAKRNKRLLDLSSSFIFLLFSPILAWSCASPLGFIANAWAVFWGQKSWLGYAEGDSKLQHLPKLRPSVLSPADSLPQLPDEEHSLHRINLFYAKDYYWSEDARLIWENWRKLGRKKQPARSAAQARPAAQKQD